MNKDELEGQADDARAGAVKLFDVVRLRTLCHFRAHWNALAALAFDNSGTLLVTAALDGQVCFVCVCHLFVVYLIETVNLIFKRVYVDVQRVFVACDARGPYRCRAGRTAAVVSTCARLHVGHHSISVV